MSAPRPQCAAPRSTNGGFVLVAVLWMVAALATLASIYSVYATNTAAGSRVGDDRLQAELSIRAGAELAAYQVLAFPEPARPTHGHFDVAVGRSRVAVEYRTETARIDLNAAPKELLAGLFRAVGANDSAAQAYAERVVGWRTTIEPNADNPEERAYASAGLAYRPRQAPFEDTLELALVLGLPQSIVERTLPLVTVFSGRARVDVSSSDPMTLAALPGMTPDVLHTVLKARQKTPDDGRALLSLFGAARDRATADPSKAMRATIHVDLDDGRRIAAEVVFQLRDGGDEPFDILYWRDDIDGPWQAS
jgi:general secretion pathway protein K